jgi:hypothetical protein
MVIFESQSVDFVLGVDTTGGIRFEFVFIVIVVWFEGGENICWERYSWGRSGGSGGGYKEWGWDGRWGWR